MTAHKHANLMMQYAQDAAETDTPWEMWEYKLHGEPWFECQDNPAWSENIRYRRKPEVIKVGKHEFPKPMDKIPEYGTSFWIVEVGSKELTANSYCWEGCQFDLKYFRNGLCHLTKQAAEAHAKVLTAICKGDV